MPVAHSPFRVTFQAQLNQIKLIMKNTLALITASFLSASIALAAPETGKPAPDFTLKDSAGNEHSLADFKGKPVVLEWFNVDCPFVKKFYGPGKMQEMQKAATTDGTVWLTIISSAPGKQGHLTPEAAEAKRTSGEVAGTAILLDEDGSVGKLYDAKTTPHMFVIDAEGTLVYAGAIDSNPSASSDDIDAATNYVEAALKAVADGTPVETATTTAYGCSVKYQ